MVDAREYVMNILEEKGVINKFKSELRAQVLKAMNKSLTKPETLAFLDTDENQLILSLIWDFFESAKLNNTLEIFLAECNLNRKTSRSDLEFSAGIKFESGKPMLSSVLELCKRTKSTSPDPIPAYIPSKFPEKTFPKVSEIGILNKKDDRSSINKLDPPKPAERASVLLNPPSSLTSLPKPNDKVNDRLKLQPLGNPKKIANLKSFDVLLDDNKPVKLDTPESSIEESIDESIEEDHKELYESQGTSSMGVDASVNSLALEEFDHIELIRPPKKRN